jgi:hypothetical protein
MSGWTYLFCKTASEPDNRPFRGGVINEGRGTLDDINKRKKQGVQCVLTAYAVTEVVLIIEAPCFM